MSCSCHRKLSSALFVILFAVGTAFTPNASIRIRPLSRPARATSLKMAPRFDPSTEKWYPTSPEDEDGYGAFGTLLRAGPKPFIIRLVNSDNYEQGVFKFMANENMSRLEAQGNFDAYLENPNDWAYQYLQEKNGKYKKDYVNEGMDTKSLVLKGAWTALLLGLAARGVYCYNTGINFYEFLKYLEIN